MARPLVRIQSANEDEETRFVPLPAVFSAPIRLDIVQQVHTNMRKNSRQPYAVNRAAGMEHSAESWGTGRAVARVPRVSGSGTHRAGQAAFANMCRKGRMFAPTKTWRKWHRRINNGQKRFAVCAAIAATAVPSLVFARGHRIDNVAEIPLVVADNDIHTIEKTKAAYELLETLEATDDIDRVKSSRKLRAGKGKRRNRRFVQRKGPLVIYKQEDSAIRQAFRNIPGVDLVNVNRLNLLSLAPGGHIGRFVIWTESAFKSLDDIFGTFKAESKQKSGFSLPHPKMTNTDLARLFNSPEVQSRLRPKVFAPKLHTTRKNPLKNFGFNVKLNPNALVERRRAILASQKTEKKAKQVRKNRASERFMNNLTAPQAPLIES